MAGACLDPGAGARRVRHETSRRCFPTRAASGARSQVLPASAVPDDGRADGRAKRCRSEALRRSHTSGERCTVPGLARVAIFQSRRIWTAALRRARDLAITRDAGRSFRASMRVLRSNPRLSRNAAREQVWTPLVSLSPGPSRQLLSVDDASMAGLEQRPVRRCS